MVSSHSVSLFFLLVLITHTQSFLIDPAAPSPRYLEARPALTPSSDYYFSNTGNCQYLAIDSPVEAPPTFNFGFLSNSSGTHFNYSFVLTPSILMFLNQSGSLLGSVPLQANTWVWPSEVITTDLSYLFTGFDTNSSVFMSFLVSPLSQGAVCSYLPSFFNLSIPADTTQLVLSTNFCWYQPINGFSHLFSLCTKTIP